MKYIESGVDGRELPVVELSRRNLETLLTKLDDPLSMRSLIDGENRVMVRAVENKEHYSDRDPGVVYMPSSGEYL